MTRDDVFYSAEKLLDSLLAEIKPHKDNLDLATYHRFVGRVEGVKALRDYLLELGKGEKNG